MFLNASKTRYLRIKAQRRLSDFKTASQIKHSAQKSSAHLPRQHRVLDVSATSIPIMKISDLVPTASALPREKLLETVNATPMGEITVGDSRRLASRISSVDGLRAVAVLMVFFYHAQANLAQSWPVLYSLRHLTAGVDLFMVLSGFCLFLPICKSREALERWSVRDFARRRFRRIVPPYYAAIVFAMLLPQLLVFVFRAAGIQADWQPFPSLFDIVTHVLFIHTLWPETWGSITGAFWSLGLEAQFYATFPLVVLFYKKIGIKVVPLLIAISLCYRLGALWFTDLSVDHQMVVSTFFLGRWMQFALGMGAAWWVQNQATRHDKNAVWGTMALLGVLALCVAASWLEQEFHSWLVPWRDLVFGMAFALSLMAICASKTPFRALLESRFMIWLGGISYSVFLIHQPILWYLSEFLSKKTPFDAPMQFFILSTLGLAFVLFASSMFFKLVERPFLSSSHQPLSLFKARERTAAVEEHAAP